MPSTADTHAPVPASAVTFRDAWVTWLVYRSSCLSPLRASTLADYASIYRRHLEPALADLLLADINGTTIALFTIDRSRAGVSAKRLSNILVPLRACLRWHHRIGTIERDPTPWFTPNASPSDERHILTPRQIESLLRELPPQYRPLVAFAAYVGTRAGEQRALTWDDIDVARQTARITKTYFRTQLQSSTKSGYNRTVPMPRHIAQMLAEWRPHCPASPEGLVFPGPTGRPFDLDTFRSRVFRPAVLRAGLRPDTRFHDLRHSCASLYLQSGATLREVMEIHGWRQMQTAQRYLHPPDTLTAAADRLSAARADALAVSQASPQSSRPHPRRSPP